MTRLSHTIEVLEVLRVRAPGDWAPIQLAIDILSLTRTISFLCENCEEALACEYLNLDPDVYSVPCPRCQTHYWVHPNSSLYDGATLEKRSNSCPR